MFTLDHKGDEGSGKGLTMINDHTIIVYYAIKQGWGGGGDKKHHRGEAESGKGLNLIKQYLNSPLVSIVQSDYICGLIIFFLF